MTALGYSRWRNFKKIINKSKISCNVSNINVSDRFANVGKTVPMPIEKKSYKKSIVKKLDKNSTCRKFRHVG